MAALCAACGGGGGGGTPPPSNRLVLNGTVANGAGAPLAGVAVLLGQSPATTDAAGQFSYPNLLAGRYVVSVQNAAGQFDCQELNLSADSTSIALTLPSTGAGLHATQVTPALNSTNASLNAGLTLEFSEALDPASVSSADFALTPAAGTLAVTVSGSTMTIQPSLQFTLNQIVLVELKGELRALGGDVISQPIRWRFRTAASDTFPPVLMSTEPSAGATGFPPNMALVFDFGETLAPLDEQLTVSSTPAAALTATVLGRSVLVDATGGWAFNTAYTVQLAGVADSFGNRIPAPLTLHFTTGNQPAPFRDIQPDWNRVIDRIVFASNRLGGFDIFSIDPDGTNLVRLTATPGDELHPSLSSDGVLLCYQKRGGEGDWDIFVQALTDGEPAAVTPAGANDYEPAFSRTSSRDIFYVSDSSGGASIYTMQSDGSSPRELDSTFGWGQVEPAPHPLLDRQLLFTADRGDNRGIWRKIISALDDSVTNQNLTESLISNEHAPCWNADASQIGFISDTSGVDNLWVADTAGGFPRQVTYFTRTADSPVIAPLVGDNRCLLSLSRADGGADLVIVDLVSGEILLNLSNPGATD